MARAAADYLHTGLQKFKDVLSFRWILCSVRRIVPQATSCRRSGPELRKSQQAKAMAVFTVLVWNCCKFRENCRNVGKEDWEKSLYLRAGLSLAHKGTVYYQSNHLLSFVHVQHLRRLICDFASKDLCDLLFCLEEPMWNRHRPFGRGPRLGRPFRGSGESNLETERSKGFQSSFFGSQAGTWQWNFRSWVENILKGGNCSTK